MKVLLRVGAGLALLVVLLLLGAFLLPDDYRVERSIVIKAGPDRVFALIENPRAWQRWSTWARRDPAMNISYSGPATGVGAGWQWKSATQGNGEMRFTQVNADTALDYSLYFPDFEARPTGAFRLQPVPGGTEVRWSMQGQAGLNPFMRWMNLFMDDMVGRDFEEGLVLLKAEAEAGAEAAPQ
jgi:uncharacterized protein YndB with AHSA1/START domain